MTAPVFTTLVDTLFNAGKPILGSIALALKDNLFSAMGGGVGAPRLSQLAFEELVSGSTVRSNASGNAGGGTDFTFEFGFIQRGEVEFYGTMPSLGDATVQLYRNGALQSTTTFTNVASFTESNFALIYGDTVLLTWSSSSGSPVPCTFEIRTDGGDLFCGNPSRNVGVTGNKTS